MAYQQDWDKKGSTQGENPQIHPTDLTHPTQFQILRGLVVVGSPTGASSATVGTEQSQIDGSASGTTDYHLDWALVPLEMGSLENYWYSESSR